MSEDANAMLPIIRQMHDAESDEARAGVLLQLPDVVLVRHVAVFAKACRQGGLELGDLFIDMRRAEWLEAAE
jgi:hypothetical protein